jgi:hypothetical protein
MTALITRVTTPRPLAGLPLAVWLAVAATWVALLGAVWDVSWHRTLGRDTFWSAPHLLLYAGVSGGLVAALVGVGTAERGGPGLRLGRYTLSTWYTLALIGNAAVVLTAPVDDLWHRLYGRDVDIWSAPHLLALVASSLATIGWITAIQPWLVRATGWERQVCRAVYYFFLALLLYTAWFGLNWYHMVAATRDALTYPSLVGLLLLPTLLAASLADRHGWPATMAALAFMALAALPIVGFGALLIVPALALDALTRGGGTRGIGAARLALPGIAFALLFLGVEWARVTSLPPSLPVPGARLEGRVLAPYLAAAADHPWTAPSIILALPQVLGASLVGAFGGWLLARLWRRARAVESAATAERDDTALGQQAKLAAGAVQ